MNKKLKACLVIGATILMFAGVGTSLNNTVHAAHNVGWQQIHHTVNLRTSYGKRVHLNKNQHVYVTKLTKNKKLAQIKINHKYYTLKANLLTQIKHHKAIKRYKKNNNRIKKMRMYKYNKKNKRNAKQIIKRANNKRRHNRKIASKKKIKILRSRYKVSNNQKLLKASGFVNLTHYGPDIMNKYAPNNKKAVISSNFNPKSVLWLQGHFLQKNPVTYAYNNKAGGWIKLNK